MNASRCANLILIGTVLLVTSFLHIHQARARIVPVGSTFQVNTYVTGQQLNPVIGALPDGGFVAVWESNGQDGDGLGIFARVVGFDGKPTSNEIQVSASSEGNQQLPELAVAPDGSFLIIWSDDRLGNRARLFNTAGTPISEDFQVLSGPLSQVAARPAGDFVVVWVDDCLGGGNYCVQAQFLGPGGSATGSPFQVSSLDVFHDPAKPAIEARSDNSFVISWFHEPALAPGVLEARLFHESGEPSATEFQVGEGRSGYGSDSTICTETNGQFVIAWESQYSIHFRRYDNDGMALTPPTGVIIGDDSRQSAPSVSCIEGGGVLLTWSELVRPRRFRGLAGQFNTNLVGLNNFRIGGGSGPSTLLADGSGLVVLVRCPTADNCDIIGQRLSLSAAGPCEGDCNGDLRVTVAEAVTAVGIALDPYERGTCECLAADRDLSGTVSIEELIIAVRSSLEGCR